MAIQSEAALENGLIATLRQMNYEYVQLDEETNLVANFKRQLEIHNKKKLAELGRTEFSDTEFERYKFILKGVPALKRLRNCVICFRLKWTTEKGYGWSF